jgi:ABC-type transport system substrate-binding protein
LDVWYIVPNTQMAPFDDVHCRLAVAYAIDRAAIARYVLGGAQRATYAVVPRGMLGYYAGRDNPHYNPARARAELARCPGRTTAFGLIYPSGKGYTDVEHIYAAIAALLRSVGLNVTPKPLSGGAWYTIVAQPLDRTQTRLVRNSWQEDYPDPQDYCSLLLWSGAPFSVGGWHNAAYDRLVDAADVEPDPARRAQLYVRAQHLALSQGAFISLTNWVNSRLIKPYVHGLVGSEAYDELGPRDGDWSNVWIGKH